MVISTFSEFACGDMFVTYRHDEATGQLGLELCPKDLTGQRVERRSTLAGEPETDRLPFGHPFRAWHIEPLVQAHVRGDAYPGGFAQGRTMRNSASTRSFRFVDQQTRSDSGVTAIVTTLAARGLVCEHRLSWHHGEAGLRIATSIENRSQEEHTIEMLSSFTLGGITPFDPADAPGRLVVHRLRSAWSAEGRLESVPLEALHLERSWSGHAALCERFGQAGSMPVRGFFPFVAVEDRPAGVTWAAQIAWAGSWQLELYRNDDCLSLSGGLADLEFGQWWKRLQPGEALVTPEVYLTVAAGSVDEACRRLTSMHEAAADAAPASEADLPIIVNEWCTSWGQPTHDNVVALARRLAGSAARYLVIDAGWYAGDDGSWETAHGDWTPSRRSFPQGLAATAAAIRELGLIPGLWFELETCGPDSTAFSQLDHLLVRNGAPITSGVRRFWDLRDPWVADYLEERVIGLLRDCGFGYLKVDYNETIGIGCDGAESPGEGLRQQIEAVYGFFRRLREALPDLVIENCSSGGHRSEPSMLALTAMTSFSDAHETPEIPIIAANLHRAVLPRQSQVWAVLRQEDTPQRLVYSLAATFLGRMCLSGDLLSLTNEQWALVQQAQQLYRRVWPIIKHGSSYRYGPAPDSFRHPHGWQGVLRVAKDGQEALAVVHAFETAHDQGLPNQVELPLPAGQAWRLADALTTSEPPTIVTGRLVLPSAPFTGQVVHLVRA